MSPYITVDLNELQQALKALNREFHFERHNNRPLVSRNKREGWYYGKVMPTSTHKRTHLRFLSLKEFHER